MSKLLRLCNCHRVLKNQSIYFPLRVKAPPRRRWSSGIEKWCVEKWYDRKMVILRASLMPSGWGWKRDLHSHHPLLQRPKENKNQRKGKVSRPGISSFSYSWSLELLVLRPSDLDWIRPPAFLVLQLREDRLWDFFTSGNKIPAC